MAKDKDNNTQVVDVSWLIPDNHNFNVGNEEGKQLIARSFREHGAGRSVLLDKNNRLIAGNKAAEGAIASGIKRVRIIETTGDELVAVKRTDIDLDSAEGRKMAYLDNLTQQVSLTWDQTELEAVQAEVEGFEVSDFGYEIDSLPHVEVQPTGETEEEAIERKRREFEEKMEKGELDEDDPEYQEFLKKFEAKKTTDDCYTPENVFEAVASWVCEEYRIDRAAVIRPFWPGGDYRAQDYPDGCAVIDNPPFSILAEIQRFYIRKGIRFFLFAPTLTMIATRDVDSSYVLCGVGIVYENGAEVNTSFITNMETDLRLRTAPALYKRVSAANEFNLRKIHRANPKYVYPSHVLTAACYRWNKYGIDYRLRKDACVKIARLDQQKQQGKAIFGGGFLLSERAAAERAAAERSDVTIWELSERERAIIEGLK